MGQRGSRPRQDSADGAESTGSRGGSGHSRSSTSSSLRSSSRSLRQQFLGSRSDDGIRADDGGITSDVSSSSRAPSSLHMHHEVIDENAPTSTTPSIPEQHDYASAAADSSEAGRVSGDARPSIVSRPSLLSRRMHSKSSSLGTIRPGSSSLHSRSSSSRTVTPGSTPSADLPSIASTSQEQQSDSLQTRLANRIKARRASSALTTIPSRSSSKDRKARMERRISSPAAPSSSSSIHTGQETASSQAESDAGFPRAPSPFSSISQRPASPPYINGATPLTPPEEQDYMFEERQRARRMIEAVLSSSARSEELAHPPPGRPSSLQSEQPIPNEIIIRPPNEDDELDPPEQVITIRPSPMRSAFPNSQEGLIRSTDAETAGEVTVTDGEGSSGTSIPVSIPRAMEGRSTTPSSTPPTSRIYASLPRRALSRAPSPFLPVSEAPSSMAEVPHPAARPELATLDEPRESGPPTSIGSDVPIPFSSFNAVPTPSATDAPAPAPAPAPQPPSLPARDESVATASSLVPRRILVQGIVARSPQAAARSVPSRPSVVPADRSTSHRAEVMEVDPIAGSSNSENVAAGESAQDPSGDSGFWGELRETSSSSRSNEAPPTQAVPQAESQRTAGQSWDEAVAELLSLPSEDAAAPSARVTEESAEAESEEVDDSDPGQARLIGRLLSIAAAATAATLLPGSISINGQAISGFDDPLTAATSFPGMGAPMSHPLSTAHSAASRRPSHASNTSTTSPSSHSTATASDSAATARPASSLQTILRNALANAFRTTSREPADSESAETGTTSSSTGPAADASSSTPTAAQHTPASVRPSRISPFGGPLFGRPSSSASQPSSQRAGGMPSGGVALAIPVAALQADPDLSYGRAQPEGTFERFIADLQTEVSQAIDRHQEASEATPAGRHSAEVVTTAEAEETMPLLQSEPAAAEDAAMPIDNDAPAPPPLETAGTAPFDASSSASAASTPSPSRPFSFFRAFRFPHVRIEEIRSDGENGTPSTTAATSSDPPEETRAESAEPATSSMPGSLQPGTSPSPPNIEQAASPTAPVPAPVRIVPMIMVGVRSLGFLASQAASATASSTGATAATGESASEAVASSTPVSAPSASADADSVMQDATPHTARTETATLSDAPQASAASAPAEEAPSSGARGYILWIMGGFYPSNHPLVVAPSLMGDEGMTYEDMLRLAEVMGQHKPPTATKEEIAKSALQIVKSEAVAGLHEQGKVLDITADRCLVCLEDYEPDEDVRILSCRHCFHKDCVDRWLLQGANTCPACRTAGVEKQSALAGQQQQSQGAAAETATETTTNNAMLY